MTFEMTKKYAGFLESLKVRVAQSRIEASRKVNRELILLYHYIGSEILKEQKRKGWGAQVVDQLSKDLSSAFPEMKGFSPANLRNMRKFAQLYPDVTILQQAAGELPWYHHVVLMEKIKDSKERQFYINKTMENGWSRSVLFTKWNPIYIYARAKQSLISKRNYLTHIQTWRSRHSKILIFLIS